MLWIVEGVLICCAAWLLLMQAAPTIVMTQRGARQGFQAHLRSRGVEVVEFDFLTPDNVADYCYERGFLQVHSSAADGWFCCCLLLWKMWALLRSLLGYLRLSFWPLVCFHIVYT